MKKVFHKLLSITMALVVLFSTMSFTVDMHYCGDTLVDASIFEKSDGCGMSTESKIVDDCFRVKKSCCSDKQFVVDGQDELPFSVDKISVKKIAFVASFLNTYFYLFEDLGRNAIPFKNYRTPQITKDFSILFQTFLI